jgi:hypothetical protein
MAKKSPDPTKRYQMIDAVKDANDVTYVRLSDVIQWLAMSAGLEQNDKVKAALVEATRLLGDLL